MSERYRTPEEYAKLYARDHHISVEEAKQTAAYRSFATYHSDRVRDIKKEENKA